MVEVTQLVIVLELINNYLESHNYLTVSQSGFLKRRSCTPALINVVEDLRSELDENSESFLVLHDHNNPFDILDHKTSRNSILLCIK